MLGKTVVYTSAFLFGATSWSLRGRTDYANTPIRVLLDCCATQLSLEYLTEPVEVIANSKIILTLSRKKIEVKWLSAHTIVINGQEVRAASIQLNPGDRMSSFRYRAQAHRGSITLYPEKTGIGIVNILPIELYLAGTLAGEMSPGWEIEALKAQAVASRSFAIDRTLHPRNSRYDLASTTLDQVYVGAGIQDTRIWKAIQQTAGILLWAKGRPLKAYYHSRCGGTTQPAREVWPDPSAIATASVSCPYCRTHKAAWKTEVEKTELFNAFGFAAGVGKTFELFADRNPSGYARSITIQSPDEKRTLSSDRLRSLLGYTRLKSALFGVRQSGDSAIFEGTGNGHGVGMCQWGARHLAKQGKSFREILVYYYPGAEIK